MGYDLSQPNDKPGICRKCKGTGVYQWGACVNGKMTKSGPCFSCKETGFQDEKQIKTNQAYNEFKIVAIMRSDM